MAKVDLFSSVHDMRQIRLYNYATMQLPKTNMAATKNHTCHSSVIVFIFRLLFALFVLSLQENAKPYQIVGIIGVDAAMQTVLVKMIS